jgi:hypothetical protein
MKSLFSVICVSILSAVVAATGASAASLSSSQKLEVKAATSVDVLTKALWDRFGTWCGIAEWHPAVRSCTEGKEGDATYRSLSLQDGGKIKEKLLSAGPATYRYSIVESPLPVKNYEAEFSVVPSQSNKDEVEIVWSAAYDAADGKSDADAQGAIDGIFKDGLASIKTKLPKEAPSGGKEAGKK